LNCPKKIAVF